MGAGIGTMQSMSDIYILPPELVLGTRLNTRVPEADQKRQRIEVEEILGRLSSQPGVVLADEVGMGKTFVALAIAYSVAISSPRGPVVVMVPANLIEKWEQDLNTFCELYLENREPVKKGSATWREMTDPSVLRYGVARHSVELMRLIDDPRPVRCHMIFLSQGAMGRRQSDKWIRLALIAESLRRHGRGKAIRLIKVKSQIHRFLAELLWAIGEERAHGWGEMLWQSLLKTDPSAWKSIYNEAVRDERRQLVDDPVPKSVSRAMNKLDLAPLAEVLKYMPVHASGGDARVSERVSHARKALRVAEEGLWKELLVQTRWRSPLLVVDEAHHLKNPGTLLARQLQSIDTEEDLRLGDGAMARSFDRMLFLTATPFQLGHNELINVLKRFGDVCWDENKLGDRERFHQQLSDLNKQLNESQRTAIALQRSWSRLRPEDCDVDVEDWWKRLLLAEQGSLNSHQRSVRDAYGIAKAYRDASHPELRRWVVRHNKGTYWAGTTVIRRQRVVGAAIAGHGNSTGLPIPPKQLLPFFLGARSAANPGKDLLGEALCSSYEAFRFTRHKQNAGKDEQDDGNDMREDLTHSRWYLEEFDRALGRCSGAIHPKVDSTVRRVVDLWEAGEKVLVFAFYRRTCRALGIHISQEIEQRIMSAGGKRAAEVESPEGKGKGKNKGMERLLERVQKRYFDDMSSPGRKAIDAAIAAIIRSRAGSLERARMSLKNRADLTEVMRRFLRVSTTLIRCFPIGELDSINPVSAVARTLDYADGSGQSWREKFGDFIDFLTDRCSTKERNLFLEAALRTQTGGIRVEDGEEDEQDAHGGRITLANVRVATGTTPREIRARLMRAFNTPFFPDILVCSEVMGEGVDLQRFCRYVVHHDLDWNPSSIEQRTGRIDRLGCKAESRQPIVVYLPYLAGTADERQYRVMSDREQWFRVVMGQDEVARLITPETTGGLPLPNALSDELSFRLGLEKPSS